jgi:O-antigen ligase/tetratricopeptide (TPR) repeat protein
LKKQFQKKPQTQMDNPVYVFILLGVFSLIFLISPYFRGLFFHENYYWVSLLIHVLFLSTLALNFRKAKETLSSNKSLIGVMLAIPLIYTFSYWYSISPFYASNEAIDWFSYTVIFFMMLIWISTYNNSKNCLMILCWATLAWIVGLVFFADLRLLTYQDAVIWLRFASVFQYPNTYASIVSAFVVVGLMGLSKKGNYKVHLAYGLLMIPFLVSFLAAESRGGLLVLAVGLFVAMFFLAWKEQILFMVYSITAVASSFFGLQSYQHLIETEKYLGAGILILVISIFFALIVSLIHNFINARFALYSKSRLKYIIPAGTLVFFVSSIVLIGSKLGAGVLSILPQTLQDRVSTINFQQHSVQERFLFYKDSFQVWQDHFWLGAGGGGWRALFESYKSLPYFSTQAHSFYMQTLVEVGVIGSLFVFGFFAYVLFKGVQAYINLDDATKSNHNLLAPALVAVIVLMLHNTIDFNMSFGTYNLFLFTLLAIIWSYTVKQPEESRSPSGNDESKTKHMNSTIKLPSISYKQKNLLINVSIAFMILTSLFGAYKSFAYAQAEGIYKEARTGGDFDQLMGKANRMISLHGSDQKFREYKIQLLDFAYQEKGSDEYIGEIKNEYQTLLKLNSTNFLHYMRYADFLWKQDQYKEALENLSTALELAPWVQMVYEENVKYRIEYMLMIKESNNQKETELQKEQLAHILNQLEEKLTIQKQDLPEGLNLTNPIQLTDANRQLFGKAYYYLGKFELSLDYLSAVDLNKIDERYKLNVLIYQALMYHQLNQQNKLQELLSTDMAESLGLDQIYIELLNDPQWLPITE